MTTIVLFDIDGTLLTAHGAGRRAMEAGFSGITGRDDGLAEIRFAGMTDPSIVRAGLEAIGAAHDEHVVERVIEHYLEHLPAQLSQRPPRVLPGVPRLLDWVGTHSGVAVGVGTGNVERGARAKLRAAGLDEHFAFGGFGSDHEERAQLLRVGAARGAAQLRRSVEDCRVVVVGDTPRDVAAARAIHAECVAVATSYYDRAALEETGADLVVDDLATADAHEWLRQRLP